MPQGRALRNIAAAGLALLAFATAPALAQSSCAIPGNDGVATISAYPNTVHPGSGTAVAGTTSVSLGTRNAAGAAVNIAPGDLVLIVQMQDASIDSSNTASYGGSSQGAGFTSIGASGLYEYATVAVGSATVGAGGGTLTLSAPLLNTYTSANANGSQGQRRFQVLRVPQNSNLTLSGTISAPPWDGNSGGVIAIEAAGQLNWGGATLDAAGRGFRGGGGQCSTGNGTGVTLNNTDYRTSFGAGAVNLAGTGNVPNGAKGEGVAGTPILVFVPTAPNNNTAGSVLWACSGGGTTGTACPAQDGSSAGYPGGTFGRGAPGNAGGGGTDGDPDVAVATGNDQNTGGAGGGNYSTGGHGGYGWTPGIPPGFDTGGFGGAAVPSSPARLFFGGGGGSATTNNCTGAPANGAASSGAAGGGMVFVRAGSTSGAGNINVQGTSANTSLLNDASGGGGAGGSALVFVNNSGGATGATINASGGNGGNNTGNGAPHGPGGGGSGGFAVLSGSASINVAGGANGTTAASPTSTIDYGSTASSGGVQYVGLTANQIPGAGASPVCYPRITVTKTTTTPSILQGGTANYRITAANAAGFGTAQVVRLTDVLPANPNFTFAATNSVTLGGGATRPVVLNPAAAATSPAWGDFTLPGGGSVSIDFSVNVLAATATGTYQNPATVDYLDPTRSVATTRISPAGTYTSGGVVPGSNYNPASSTNEDVTVRAAVTIAKAFNPTSIADGGVTTLTITLTNPNAVALTNAAFTDNYPSGLENAAAPAGATTCVGGAVTAVAGNSTVALAGATIPASGSCTVTVNVTAPLAQTYVNSIPAGALTDTENVSNAVSTGGTLLGRPRVVKSFSPIAVPQNTDSTLSIAITNPNATQALTLSNPALSDNFPAGMVATGGAVTYTGAGCAAMAPTVIGAGAASFSITAGTLGAGGTCTASFAVRSATVGSYPNTTTGVITTQTPNAGNPSNTASLGVGVINISKAFGTTAPFGVPGRIRQGQSNTITFTLVNPTGVAQANGSFTDSLANMSVAAAAVGGTCTGMTPASLVIGATSLSFTGINIPAGSCTITVSVTSNTVGAQNNTTSGVTTTLLPQGPPSNTDTLYVFGPPTITKTFSPAAIGPGTTSTMILTISNPNALPLTGLTFTDTYPVAPAALVNATPLAVGGTCTGVTTTATAGGGTFNVSVGNLPAGASCTITSAVTANTPGTYTNTTSGVTTAEAAVGAASNAAQLVVLAPPTIAKAFAPATIGAGGTTTLTFTLTNPNATALTNARFTDTFSGMSVASSAIGGTCVGAFGSPPPASGDTFVDLRVPSLAASASCTVTLTVTSATTGTQANTSSGITTTQTPTAGAPSNTANLAVLATPTIAKSFAPGTIQTGGATVLTLTLANPNGATTLNNVSLTDTLVNMTLVNTTVGGTCAGVTFAPALSAGGTQVNPTVASLAAGASCTITLNVTSSVVSSATGHPNTTSGATSTQTPTAGASSTAYLEVLGPPTIAKSFVPSAITVNGVATMVFTITNPNPVPLTAGRFTDTFPANLAINNVNQNFIGAGRGTCTTAIPSAMTAGAAPAINPLVMSNVTVPANGSCTIMVDVTSAVAGNYNNSTSGMTSTQTPTAGPVSNTATLRVMTGPTLAKAFVTNPILVNGTTVMRFTVTNANPTAALTNITFTDTLSNMTVSNAVAAGTCAGVTFSPALTVGGTQVNPTVPSLAAASNCTIDVTVQSTVGSIATGHPNTTSGPSSLEVPTAGTAASAVLYVVTPPTFTKSFAPAGVAINTNSTATFLVTNTSPFALSAVGFTDTFPVAPGVMTAGGAASTNAPCGGTLRDQTAVTNINLGDTAAIFAGGTVAANGTCTFNFPLRAAAAGLYTNTTTTLAWTATTPAGTIASTSPAASDVLTVGQSSVAKAFGAATVVRGQNTTLTITLTNNSGGAFAGTVGFTDALTGGMTVVSPPVATNTCAGVLNPGSTNNDTSLTLAGGTLANGGTCAVTVTVKANNAGVFSNTANGTGALAGKTDTASITVLGPPTVAKVFSAAVFTTGETPTLTITLTNPNSVAITGVVATDTFPLAPGAMTVAAPLTTTNTCGGALQNNGGGALAVGSAGIRLNGGTIPANGSCAFSVNVTAATAGAYANTIAIGGVTTTNAGSNTAAASASITFAPTALTKAFAPTSIAVGGVTTLSFTLSKTAAVATQSGIGFTDTLPAGLVVAGTPNIQTNCPTGGAFAAPGFTVTAAAGSSSIAVSAASINNAVASCVIRVDVTTSATPSIAACPVAGNTNGAASISALANLDNTVTNQCVQVAAAVPALTKAFAPAAINTGATTTLTFTVTQPAGNGTQSFSFNDTLPAGLVIGAGAVGGTCAGGAVTAPAGGTTISVAGRQISTPSCTITVPVTTAATPTVGSCPGTPANTNDATAISGTTNITNGVTSQCLAVSAAPPSLTKSFSPVSIPQGGTSTLTFTVANGAGNPAQSSFGFTDNLPANVVVAGVPNAATTCGTGTVTASAGATSVALAAGTLTAGQASCIVRVDVTSALANSYTNDSTRIAGASGGLITTGVNASLTVYSSASLTKAFNPLAVGAGSTSTLTFTLANGSGNPAQAALAFNDTLAANLVVAAVPNIRTNCPAGGALGGVPGGMTVTATAGGGSISVSGAALNAGVATCQVAVDVTSSTVGAYPNTSANISGLNGGLSAGGVSSTLTVSGATLAKAFSPATIGVGATSQLTFTVTNGSGNPAQAGLAFLDALPSGLVIATPNGLSNTCGGAVTAAAASTSVQLAGGALSSGTASCTIQVNVTSATAGSYTNASGNLSGVSANLNAGSVNASLAVVQPTLTKAFAPATMAVGGTATLTFTLTNGSGNPAQSGINFTDTLQSGIRIAATPAIATTCPSGTGVVTAVAGTGVITVTGATMTAAQASCTISVNVTPAPSPTVAACPAAANTNGSGDMSALARVTNGVTPQCVTVTAAAPTLDKAFSAALTVGGTTTLTFTVTQPAGNPTQTFSFTDTLPAGLVVGAGAVGGSCSGGSVTATAGSGTITVAGRQIVNPATSCTITVPITTAAAPTVATCPAPNNTNGTASISATTNISAAVSNSAAGGGSSATGACVTVNAATPTMDKAFSAGLTVGGTTTLTFTVSQPTGNPTQAFSFTDTLPAGLVVGAGAVGGTCSGGSVTATAGSGTITAAGRQVVNPATSCTITVPVTTAAAPTVAVCPAANNTNGTASISAITNLSAAVSNSAAGGGTSTTGACVTVTAAVPSLDKAFSAGLTVGGTTTLTFTVSQPPGNPTQTFGFTDTLPAGLVIGAGAVGGTCTGGSVTATAGSATITVASRQLVNPATSCTITVPVTTAAAPSVAVCPTANNTNGNANVSATTNISSAIANSAAGGGTSTTGACVTVAAATPTMDKAFSGALTVGGATTLTFTVSQPAGNPTQAFSFTDTLPAGLVVGAGAVGGTCSGGSVTATAGTGTITVTNRQVVNPATSCTITVPITNAAAPTVGVCPAANNTNGTASISATTNVTAAVSNSAAGGGTSATGACVTVNAAVPALDKAFSAGLSVGGTTTLTFTLSQPAGNPTQSFSFTDTLPAGLVVGAGAVGGTCSGGSVTATAGSSAITVASRQLVNPATSCTITVPVTTAAAPTLAACPAPNNTNGTASISATTNVTAAVSNSAAGGGTSATGACVTVTAATPSLNKAFSAALTVGGNTTLTFTVAQPAGNPTSTFSFTDTLPAGLVVGAGAVGGTCTGGSVTATAGSGTITVASRQIVNPATSCTITVPVTTAAAPTVGVCPAANNTNGNASISATTNIVAAIANSAAGGGASVTGACVTVVAATPTMDKAFSGALTVGGTTTLTFTVSQPTGNPTQAFSFTDTLPAGLVVGAGAVGGTCANGSVTATAGASTITVAGRQIVNPATSCTITVPVTTAAAPTVGVCPAANNTNGTASISATTNVTPSVSNSAAGGGTSTTGACVTVTAAAPTLNKAFSAGLTVGGTTTLTFTATQPAGNPTQTFSFTDTLPAGLVIGAGAVGGTCTGGSVTATAGTAVITVASRQLVNPATSCTITVPVTTAAAPTVATCPAANNTNGNANVTGTTNISAAIANSAAGGGTSTTGACVSVAAAVPTLDKAFSGALTIGGVTTLTFTVSQPAGNPAQLVSFTDTLPAGLVVGAGAVGGTCTGGSVVASAGASTITVTTKQVSGTSCTVTVPIAAANAPTAATCPSPNNTNGSGNISATTNITAAISNSAAGGGTSTTGACVTVNAAVPALDKAFSAGLTVGGTTTLTFTLTQPASNPTQAVSFTDTLPAGLVVGSGAVGGTCAGGSVTATAGSATITVAGRQASGASCTITVPVTTAAAPTVAVCPAANNTNGTASISAMTNVTAAVSNSAAGGGTSTTGACVSVTAATPTLDKAFSAGLTVGGTTTLTFTVSQPAGNPTSTFSFTDTLPAGLLVGSGAVGGSCSGGSVTATAGSGTITVAGRQLVSPATSCTITVPVTTAAAPTVSTCPAANNTNGTASISATTNVAAAISNSAAGGGTSTTGACVAVSAAVPSLNKAFSAGLTVGGTTTLTFTISQPAGNPAQAFSFTDTLPAGLVVGAGAVGGTCAGGSVTATAGTGTITVASRQVSGASCTITVPITSAAAPTVATCPAANNTNGTASISATTNLTAAVANSAAGGGTSTTGACVTVAAATPTLDKAFGAGLTVGGTTTLTFTLSQPAGNPAQSVSFTDTLPAGLVVGSGAVGGTCAGGSVTATAGTSTITVAGRQVSGASCTITVPITTAAVATVGTCPAANNTNGTASISATTNVTAAVSNSAAGGGSSTTGACVTVSAATPTLDKAFSGGLTVGGSTTLTFTLSQAAGNPTSTFSFTDTLPAGLVVGSGAVGGTCSGGTVTASAGSSTITVASRQLVNPATSCTITVPITTSAAPSVATCPAVNDTNGNAQFSGAANVSVAVSNSAAGGGTSTTGACVTVGAAVPVLTKGVSPGSIAIGATTTLTFTITQPAGNPTQTFSFTDTLPSGLVVGSGAVGGTCSGGSVTATAGTSAITVAGRQLVSPATSCTITVPITTSGAPDTSACPAAANTNGAAQISATTNLTNSVTNQCVTVFAPPSASKSFTPATIGAGQASALRLVLTNPAGNSAALTTLVLGDPIGSFALSVAAPATAVFTPAACGTVQSRATVGSGGFGALTAGHLEIQLSVASLAPGASCQVDVNVTSTTPGIATNVTAAPTATGPVALTGTAASASITVRQATLAKAFSLAAIDVNGVSTLTFTLNNGAGNPAQSGINFTDTLPAGVVVAGTPNVATTCPSGTGVVAAGAGAASITVTGAAMSAAQASCTISVDVTAAAAGTYLNNSANLGAVQRIDVSGASATLTVSALPALTKAFAAANVGIGQSTTLTFQLANTGTNAVARSAISFTDTLPAGLVIANPAAPTSSNCGAPTFTAVDGTQPFTASSISIAAGATCSVTLAVRGTTLGAKTNNAASITAISGAANGVTPQVLTVVQPSLDKAFGPTTISVNGTSTLTFTLTNGTGNPAEAGIGFTDTLPGNVRVAAAPNVTTNCPAGGAFAAPAFTVTAAAGSTSVAISGASMAAAVASCQVRVDVTAAIGGSYVNNAASISGTANVTNAVNPSTLTVNAAAPSLTKAFGTSPVNANTASTLTITLSNPNASVANLTLALTDTLPAPLVVAPTPNASTTCSGAGAVTASAGSNSITLPGTRSIPAAAGLTPGTCTVTVDVVSPFGGSFINTIPAGALQTSNGNNAAAASATLAVNPVAPTIAKAFGPATIAADGSSTITFTLTNANAFALTAGSFTDTLAQMSIAAPLTAGGTCAGAGGNTYSSGQTGLITVSGLTLPAASGATAGSCTVTLAVTSDFPGPHNNQASGVNATGAPAGAASNVAVLTVTAAPATIAKAFSPASIGIGGTSTITFTLGNTNGVPLTGAQFTDTLANMAIASAQSAGGTCAGAASNAFAAGQTALGFSGITIPANATCTVTITVTSSTVGVQNNTTSGVLTNEAATGPASNTATLTVTAATPTITKSFTPATINSGQVSTLQVTISNPNASAITVTSLTDSFPSTPGAGLARATTPNASAGASCGGGTVSSTVASVTLSNATIAAGGSCTFQIDVTASSSGSYVNSIPVGSLNSSAGSNTAAASATLTVNPVANIAVNKLAPATIGTGALLSYSIAITNAGPDAAPGTTFSDTVPAQLTGVTASCTGAGGGAACGAVSVVGNTVTTTIPTLPSGGSVALTISGTAQGVGIVTNTATVAPPAGVTDPVAANNTSSASTNILAPDLTITKTHAGNFTVGTNGTYTIVVTNQPGALSTTGPITVTDTLPAGLGFVSATGTGWACGFGSGTVTCIQAAVLAPGQVANPISLVVSVASIAVPSVTNFATVSGGGEPAATSGNNTASDNTIVVGAAVNAFAPNNAQTGMPGTVVFYAHTFNAGLAGSVQFTTSAITTPAAPAWSQIVYRDTNCNGTLDAGEGTTPLTAPIAVVPGDQVCIIVKDSIPANAPYNATNNITVTATFNGAQTYTRTDLTTVGAAGGAGLTLGKTVRNVTLGGAPGTTGSARPNDVLEYTITYTNAGSGPLSAIVITDATPGFTSYLSSACTLPLPASLTGCAVTTAPAVGAMGSVVWTLTGTLLSNGVGSVSYQVRVSP